MINYDPNAENDGELPQKQAGDGPTLWYCTWCELPLPGAACAARHIDGRCTTVVRFA